MDLVCILSIIIKVQYNSIQFGTLRPGLAKFGKCVSNKLKVDISIRTFKITGDGVATSNAIGLMRSDRNRSFKQVHQAASQIRSYQLLYVHLLQTISGSSMALKPAIY